jgi:hypothetical protein
MVSDEPGTDRQARLDHCQTEAANASEWLEETKWSPTAIAFAIAWKESCLPTERNDEL